jgi:hypothetical protein
VEPADASKLASVLALLARLTEGDSFDERLTALEARLSDAAARSVVEARRCR